MGITRLPSGSFRVQIRRKSLNFDETFPTEQQALDAEQRMKSSPAVQAQGKRLSELWDDYAASSVFEAKSINTQKTEKVRIKPVLAKLGNYAISELELRTDLIYEYIDERMRSVSARTRKKRSGSTVRLEVAALSALIAFAKKRRLIRENFVSGISRPVTKARKRRVPTREQGALQIYARNSDQNIAQAARFALLIRFLGCRPGELAGLLHRDVNLQRKELICRDTKNGQDRCIHVTQEAATMLNLQLTVGEDSCPYVFGTWSKAKECWVPYNYAWGMKLLRRCAGIEADFCAHAGRREFISRAIEENIPLTTIKKQTGHKSVQALEMYDQALSTAPEQRKVWDRLAGVVADENLLGVFENLGATSSLREQLKERFHITNDAALVKY